MSVRTNLRRVRWRQHRSSGGGGGPATCFGAYTNGRARIPHLSLSLTALLQASLSQHTRSRRLGESLSCGSLFSFFVLSTVFFSSSSSSLTLSESGGSIHPIALDSTRRTSELSSPGASTESTGPEYPNTLSTYPTIHPLASWPQPVRPGSTRILPASTRTGRV
jgi:hypothetical protein